MFSEHGTELFYSALYHLYFIFVGGSTGARALGFSVPNHKHLMCGFFSEGCCDHLVHLGDEEGRVGLLDRSTNWCYFVRLLFYFCVCLFFYVIVSLGFIYGAHLSVYTIWPI